MVLVMVVVCEHTRAGLIDPLATQKEPTEHTRTGLGPQYTRAGLIDSLLSLVRLHDARHRQALLLQLVRGPPRKKNEGL